jgi:hypothetical protein
MPRGPGARSLDASVGRAQRLLPLSCASKLRRPGADFESPMYLLPVEPVHEQS